MFPYRKFIMLDVDLKFRVDVAELFRQYEEFDADQMIGVGSDLAPHYYHVLRFYRESNPGTEIGKPGRFQGFNTGVVLFNLDRMRRSELYNSLVENRDGIVDKLAQKYQFKSHLGTYVGARVLSVG